MVPLPPLRVQNPPSSVSSPKKQTLTPTSLSHAPNLPSALLCACHQCRQPSPASSAPSCFLLFPFKPGGLPLLPLPGKGSLGAFGTLPWPDSCPRAGRTDGHRGEGTGSHSGRQHSQECRRAQRPAYVGSFNVCTPGRGAERGEAGRAGLSHQMNMGLPSSCASWLRQESSSSASLSVLGCTVSTSTRCRKSTVKEPPSDTASSGRSRRMP